MITLFFISLALIIYCYFGYPLLIAICAKFFSKPIRRAPINPKVSILIAVHNEADVIERKVAFLKQLDYPADKIEILIGSDASDDKTDELIRKLEGPCLRLFSFKERQGKVMVLNRLVPQATGEIIFFNDARQSIAPDALRQLVMNFADPSVGCASGELVFSTQEGGATAKGVNFYWKYEKFIRNQESMVHSMLGATGAIYAIRKELFVPGPAHVVLDDMFTPFKIIQQGYRAIFDSTAHAYDKAAHTAAEEHRRKARTLYGNYQIFFLFAGLFNPFKSAIAIQFFSHKLLRVIAPFLMIEIFLLNCFLINIPSFQILLLLQILFYVSAWIGALSRNQKYGILGLVSKVCYIPYVFCLLNFSALVGFYRFINATQESTWQKARDIKSN